MYDALEPRPTEPILNPKPFHYTDRKGRTWDLSLDFAVCRRADAFDKTAVIQEKFSLLSPDRKLLHRFLYTDRAALFAIIWAIVHTQAPGQGIPLDAPEQAELEFVSGVNGAVIEAARIAFTEALGDFFPELRIALSTWAKQTAAIQTKVVEKIEEMHPEVMKMVDVEFDNLVQKMKNDLLTQSEKRGETLLPSPPFVESLIENSSPPVTPSSVSS